MVEVVAIQEIGVRVHIPARQGAVELSLEPQVVGQYRGTEAVEQVPMKTCQIELFSKKKYDFMDKDYFEYSTTFSVLRPY